MVERPSILPPRSESGDEVGVIQRQLFVRQLMATSTATSVATQLTRNMRDVFCAEGEQLYARGGRSNELYFLVEGEVELRLEGEPAWPFTAPAVIGILDALHERPHARDAIAKTALHALVLPAADWFDVVEEHFTMTQDGVRRTSTNLTLMRLSLSPSGGFPEPRPPGEAQGGMNLVERLLLVRDVALFEAATVQASARIAANADELELPAGKVLFAEGETSHALCVVASGHVTIERKEPVIRATFGPGQVVGGALAAGSPVHPWTATAATDAIVLSLKREDMLDTMEDHTELTRSILIGINDEREALMRAGARAQFAR